ncbi:MAG TPA: cytochrome c peroxidase [Polyangiaceae bacterium]|nr:cytochrome c peroxidase [Polyangiaceae bacterium]
MAAPERALVLFAALAGACGGSGVGSPAAGDGRPVLSDDERAALASLHYDAGPPPADPSDRVADDDGARAFGQVLFFEPALSGQLLEGDNDGTTGTLGEKGDAGRVSCSGCHLPAAGFVDARSPHHQVSLAAQWTLRKTPTLLEVGFAPLYNWDGRRDAIWNQALGVMESNREFNSGRLFVAEQLFRLHQAEYESVFGLMPPFDDATRFPQLSGDTAGCVEVNTLQGSMFRCRGVPGDGADYDGMAPEDQELVTVTAVNATKSLEAYVRSLRCGPSRFDDWLDGDDTALDASELRGAALFVGRGQCVTCHSGPLLTDDAFHDVGLSPAVVAVAIQDLDDQGAATGIAAALTDPMSTAGAYSDGDRHALPATPGPELEGAFRTPTLRCAASHPSFMHTGQLTSLAQVLAFFDRGGDPPGNYPGTNELTPLGLSDGDEADLVAFLQTLTGPGPSADLLSPPSE